jgi:hypothetical protein
MRTTSDLFCNNGLQNNRFLAGEKIHNTVKKSNTKLGLEN